MSSQLKMMDYTPKHIYQGKIIRVIDGDTVVVQLDGLPFRMGLTLDLRIKDVNCAEITNSKKRCRGEKLFGIKATQKVGDFCLNRRCIIKTYKRSFTRYVAEVLVGQYNEWVDLREFIITQGYQRADLSCELCSINSTCDDGRKGSFPNEKINREVL